MLSINKGDSGPLAITIPHAGMTGPLSGYTHLWFTAKLGYQNLDNDPDSIQKDIGAGVTVTTAGSTSVDGVISVALLAADTTSLPDNNISLVYDVKGKDAGGLENTLTSGVLLVQAHATKAS